MFHKFATLFVAFSLSKGQENLDPTDVFTSLPGSGDECVSTSFSRTGGECDLFIEKGPTDGPGFSIEYHNTFKVIRNEIQAIDYVGVLCGTEEPSLEELAELGVSNPVFVEIPVQKYAVTSQTILPWLHTLAQNDKFGFFITDSARLPACTPEDVIIPDCNFEPSCITESLAASGIKVAFVEFANNFAENDDFEEIFVSNGDATTMTYEDRLQWIYYLGAFFNNERLAHLMYEQHLNELTCMQSFLDSSVSAITTTDQNVLVLSFYFDFAFSFAFCPSYQCELVERVHPTAHVVQKSELGEDAGSVTAENIQGLLTAAGIRVDKIIFLSFLEKDADGTFNGPEDDNGQFTAFVEAVSASRLAVDPNAAEIPFEAFFLPETDPWFAVRPGVPHLLLEDFAKMITPERFEGADGNGVAELISEFYFFSKFNDDTIATVPLTSLETCTDLGRKQVCVADHTTTLLSTVGELRSDVSCVVEEEDSAAFTPLPIFALGFALLLLI